MTIENVIVLRDIILFQFRHYAMLVVQKLKDIDIGKLK